ncbi:MAG TPA: aconitase X catalytic domain-containing protein [Actinomycetota bacterium]|nr:aconitase X catalytic domain-containing protein [Actinomycetota bacterium]
MAVLDERDRELLEGRRGEAARMAMSIVARMADISGAPSLIDISSAHIDSCLYHGKVGLDFAQRLADGGARVVVPTTLNVGALDLLHPEHYRGDPDRKAGARHLMDLYVEMGCRPTWTCAPYQSEPRPGFGEQIAWAESNAIVFANSVIGARTDRYGDFIDICAAVTGRVPFTGLHVTENRRARIGFQLASIDPALLAEDAFYPLLGLLVGARSGSLVPVIEGLPSDTSEDRLKALGAAAASSGSVGLFHAVGVTPEADTLEEATQGRDLDEVVEVTSQMIAAARTSLVTATDRSLSAVSIGTPHFSLTEFQALLPLLDGSRAPVDLYISTSRAVLNEIERRGWLDAVQKAGAKIVVDTCTYVTPIMDHRGGAVMTNSAKWAYYAPGNLGVDVFFGSTKECVRSAMLGRVWTDESFWSRL